MKTTICLLSFFILISCSKKTNDPKPEVTNIIIQPLIQQQETILKLTVKDTLGNPVPYAGVILYSTFEDLKRDTLFADRQQADSNGIFSKVVNPTQYYWSVDSGCLSNVGTTNTSDAGFKENVVNANTVILAESGTLELINTSSDMYQIFINDVNTTLIGAKSSKKFKVKSGLVKVRILQETGYTYYATDKIYTVKVNCGKNGIVNFPL